VLLDFIRSLELAVVFYSIDFRFRPVQQNSYKVCGRLISATPIVGSALEIAFFYVSGALSKLNNGMIGLAKCATDPV